MLIRGLGLCLVSLALVGTIEAQEFRRGDVDRDGVISLADASSLQHFLIVAGSPPAQCEDAADFNDDGALNITDVIGIVQYAIGLDRSLATGLCTEDTTPDGLDCDSYDHCPDVVPLAPSDEHFLTIASRAAAPGEPVVIPIEYDNLGSARLAAISFGVTHDEALATVADPEFGTTLLDLPVPPTFFMVEVTPGGWVAGAVFQFYGTVSAPLPGTGLELFRATYELTSDQPAPLEFSDTLGDPPVKIRIHAQSSPLVPQLTGGSVVPATFVRGDANADGTIDIADVIFQLNTLFASGAVSPCRDAADVNDDGTLDLGDPIWNLATLFDASPPRALPPFDCGVDPTPDSVDCISYTPCF
ncbi:MAG: dockerin type I domain-containing protein [Planctomycetota bacterium]